jgi:O-antigen ligase
LTVIPLLSGDYIARLNTINSKDPEQEYSAGSRQVLWRAGWLMFQDHPIFGVGLLNFPRAKAPYRYDPQLAREFDQNLLNYAFVGYKVGHGTWLGQVLPEGGLFLAIPLFWLIMGFFWQARGLQWTHLPTEETRPLHNALIGLEAGLFGYCVSISFINGLFGPFLTVQIMLGVQIIRIIKRMTSTPPIFQQGAISR